MTRRGRAEGRDGRPGGALRGLTAGVAALALLAAACGDDGDDTTDATDDPATDEAESAAGSPCDENDDLDPGSDQVRAVPEDYETIQEAVDAAEPCDLVLVGPGEYNESVEVTTDDIVIRGLDRNEVILDGGFELSNGVEVLEADGVAVENMTARNYTQNGFFWTGVERYRGSYLTAHNNGGYGIYAFDSTIGLLEHSYGSGASDGAFYIGQCDPCDAVITDVVGEHSGLGYSGTNASGDLYIVSSTFRHNRTGIVPNSGRYEELWPQGSATVVGNIVHDNGNPETDAIEAARMAHGTGILVAGGNDNVVERNLVFDNELVGLGVIVLPDETDDELTFFWPDGNIVRDNVVEGSGLADIALADQYVVSHSSVAGALGLEGDEETDNCFDGNTFGLSAPVDLETVAPCDGDRGGDPEDGPIDVLELATRDTPEAGDYRTQPVPDDQENMPNADSAPWQSAGPPPVIDLDAIALPERP